MLELMTEFQAHVKAGPLWVQYWIYFMGFVFVLSLPFSFVRKEARYALLTILITFPVMMFLYAQFGYARILGLAHIIVWTPLLIYLVKRRHHWRAKETVSGKWIALLVVTMGVSLAFDVTDVVRHFLGHTL